MNSHDDNDPMGSLEGLDLAHLKEAVAPKGSAAKGPRNLPKPDARKAKRQQQKRSRKANR